MCSVLGLVPTVSGGTGRARHQVLRLGRAQPFDSTQLNPGGADRGHVQYDRLREYEPRQLFR
jgi:hypothetical protein